jgi:hypothetical protein
VGRRRRGQVVVTAGIVLAIVSSLAIAASRGVRDTDAVREAAPELLEMESVRSAVTTELARAIEELYGPGSLAAGTLAGASERMVSNGYVIDDFQSALGSAHRGWLDGTPLVIQLDARVATQAAVTALRDVDAGAANAFPNGGIVQPQPVVLPIGDTMTQISDLSGLGILGGLVGLVLVGMGAVIDSDRARTLKSLARGLCAAAVLCLLAAFVLPLPVLRDLTDFVGLLGVVAGQNITVLVVVGLVLLLVGLSLHASADRIVAEVNRQMGRARTPREATPVASGTKMSRRGAVRHRSEAIDAFFSEAEPPAEIVLGDDGEDEDSTVDAPDDASPEDGEAPAAKAPLTPEEERAAALAAERKESLERIDGSRSGYRTHLKR